MNIKNVIAGLGLSFFISVSGLAAEAQTYPIEVQHSADIYFLDIPAVLRAGKLAEDLSHWSIRDKSNQRVPFSLTSSTPEGEVDQLFFLAQGIYPFTLEIAADQTKAQAGFQAEVIFRMLNEVPTAQWQIAPARIPELSPPFPEPVVPEADTAAGHTWLVWLGLLAILFVGGAAYWFLRISKR